LAGTAGRAKGRPVMQELGRVEGVPTDIAQFASDKCGAH
jgi:hypothetical protein